MAEKIGCTPSVVAMKLENIVSLLRLVLQDLARADLPVIDDYLRGIELS